jgi:hypothetical protein
MDVDTGTPQIVVNGAASATKRVRGEKHVAFDVSPSCIFTDVDDAEERCSYCTQVMASRGRCDLLHCHATFPLLYIGSELAEFCAPMCAYNFVVRKIPATRPDLIAATAALFAAEYPRATFSPECAHCYRPLYDTRPPVFYDQTLFKLFCSAACFATLTQQCACSVCGRCIDDSGSFFRNYLTHDRLVCSVACAEALATR